MADQAQAHPGRSVPSGRCARHYEDFWADAPQDPEPWAWERRRALLLAEARPGERVLDLGCGAGRFVAALRDAGADPVGVEIAEAALERARRNAPRRRPAAASSRTARCRSSTRASTSCGARRCSSTSPTRRTLLLEVRRVLRPGGRAARHRALPRPRQGRADRARCASTRTSTRSASTCASTRARRWRATLRAGGVRGRARCGRGAAPPLLRTGLTARARAPVGARARLASSTSDVDCRRLRVEVVRGLEGAQRALRVVRAPTAAAGRAGARPRRWRAAGRPRARARAAASLVAAARLLDRRQLEQRVDRQRVARRSAIRAIDAAALRLARVEPVERRVAGVHGAHRLVRGPGRGERDREHERGGERRAAAARGRRAARAGSACGQAAAARPAAPAPSSRARSGPRPATQPAHSSATPALAGDEPGPVDGRVHAEHDDDGDQREHPDALGVERQPAVAPAQAGRAQPRRPARRAPASSETPRPDPAEVGERLHDVAVRVADRQRVVAEARAHASRTRRRRCRATARWRGRRAPRPSSGARTDEVAVSRSGVLAGVRAFGSVSWFQALETWPSIAAGRGGERDQRRSPARARARRARRGRRAGACARRRRALRGREVRRRARRPAAPRPSAAAARRTRGPASTRAAIGARSVVSPSCANAHATSGAAPSTPAASAASAAQAQRHDEEPDRRAPISQRDQRAARVGEHQAHEQQADAPARPARWPPRGRSGGRRATASAARRAPPSARPSSSTRTARAAARTSRPAASEAGKHLRQQRPARRSSRQPAPMPMTMRRPAARQQPHERDAGGEHGQVGERAVRLDPRVGGRQRPQDRQRGERREHAEGEQRAAAVQRRVGGARAPEQRGGATSAAPPASSRSGRRSCARGAAPPAAANDGERDRERDARRPAAACPRGAGAGS